MMLIYAKHRFHIGGASSRRTHRGGRPYIPEAHIPPSAHRHRPATSKSPLFYTPDTNVNPHDLYDERSPLYRAPVAAITNRLGSASGASSSSRGRASSKKGSSSVRSSSSKPRSSKAKTAAQRSPPRVVDVSQYVPAETLAAIVSGQRGNRRRSSHRAVTTGRRFPSQPR